MEAGLSWEEEQWDGQDQSVCRRPAEEEEPPVYSASRSSTGEEDFLLQVHLVTDVPTFTSCSSSAAARMARDMSDKEILKMELDQLKKEVSTPRSSVSQCPSLIRLADKGIQD